MNDLQRFAMEQALEALECVDLQSLVPDYGSGHYSVARSDGPQVKSAITALHAALAEPVQEPVAWMRVIDEAMVIHHCGVADPADDYETAKRKLNSLLCIAQDIGEYFAGPAQRPTAGATYSDIISDGGMDPR